MNNYHNSVLLQQVLDNLGIYTAGIYTKNGDTGDISKERIYVDMTLGGGGVSLKIIENLQKGIEQGSFKKATLVSIDVDNDACLNFRKLLDKHFKNVIHKDTYLLVGNVRVYIVNSNFRDIRSILSRIKIKSKDSRLKVSGHKVNGIVYDLGLSSFQIDNPKKGFSYSENSDLDMRMDKNLKVKASDLLNGLYEDELYNIFTKYGEEPFSRIIAKNIIKKRNEKEIVTSDELVKIISSSVKLPVARISVPKNKAYLYHHVSRIFQALRIAVNDELGALFDSLHQVPEILEHGGRVEIISFHSLEDRIVKNFFKEWSPHGSKPQGSISKDNKEFISLYKKPIIPGVLEIKENSRARSAKLRVYEYTGPRSTRI
jgi:16S rRNA (cytosine1402-N4)-methyltransferase